MDQLRSQQLAACFPQLLVGIPITLVTVFVKGTVANIFNPKSRLTLPEETAAHKERD
jgi:hypothetical protein